GAKATTSDRATLIESPRKRLRPSHRSIVLKQHSLMFLRKATKLAIKIVVIVVVSLMCVEFLMVVLDPYLFQGFYEFDPDLGFRVRAHFPNDEGTLTNQFGFNDRDYPLRKPEGTFRILVVGDSFSWAGGLEGNYTA